MHITRSASSCCDHCCSIDTGRGDDRIALCTDDAQTLALITLLERGRSKSVTWKFSLVPTVLRSAGSSGFAVSDGMTAWQGCVVIDDACSVEVKCGRWPGCEACSSSKDSQKHAGGSACEALDQIC